MSTEVQVVLEDGRGGLRHPRSRRMPISIGLSLGFLGVILACALAPDLIAPHSPTAQDTALGLSSPTSGHLLGTDDLGRDILSRIVSGALSAIGGPIIIALASVGIASLLGLLAGYHGRWVDTTLSRGFDVLFALPELLIAIVVVGVMGGGYLIACAVLTVLTLPHTFRLVRGAVIEQRVLPYVEATQTLRIGPARIMLRHILPNVLPVVVAALFLRFTYSLVGLAGLSFLGLGVGPGSPNWGRMLAENRVYLFENPWSALAPALVLILTAVSAVLIGDWLYERMSDRRRMA